MNFLERDFDKDELQGFLADVFDRTGYDFRNYSMSSVVRRISRIIDSEGLSTLQDLKEKFLQDGTFENRFIESLSVPTTSMFRDPQVFKLIRHQVLPQLIHLPVLRVWCVGCSTGEEPYSVAIMLQEEGLYDRTRIYATDMNEGFLNKARAGVFPIRLMQDYTVNYLASGGCADFSSFYTSAYDRVVFGDDLKRNIVFAQHNLVSDTSFNEFSLIFCRNVLIYFNSELQERVHSLIESSLAIDGFLVLGEKESLSSGTARGVYEQVSKPLKVFKKLK
jgi:chemotaxis protein methyltransferase CheR